MFIKVFRLVLLLHRFDYGYQTVTPPLINGHWSLDRIGFSRFLLAHGQLEILGRDLRLSQHSKSQLFPRQHGSVVVVVRVVVDGAFGYNGAGGSILQLRSQLGQNLSILIDAVYFGVEIPWQITGTAIKE